MSTQQMDILWDEVEKLNKSAFHTKNTLKKGFYQSVKNMLLHILIFKEVTKVNKAELITCMSDKSKLSKKDTEVALKALIESVEESLEKGEKVQLVGFGTFESRERAARVGRNPRTKEEINIPASVVPVFKAGKEFKEKVNK